MKTHKILIVDDEKNLVSLLSRLLKRLSYDIEVAFDGAQAIEAARRFKPNLVLLDIKMPSMNGIEVLKELKSDPEFAKTPVVVLSAKGQLHEINAGLEAGADEYLCKPVMLNEIVNTIKRILI